MRKIWMIGLVLGLLSLALLYQKYDPSVHRIFPKCPVHSVTGFECPGCGSQRAIHHLLNARIDRAFEANLLVPVFLPFLLIAFLSNALDHKVGALERLNLSNSRAWMAWVIFAVIFCYGILRNVFTLTLP